MTREETKKYFEGYLFNMEKVMQLKRKIEAYVMSAPSIKNEIDKYVMECGKIEDTICS